MYSIPALKNSFNKIPKGSKIKIYGSTFYKPKEKDFGSYYSRAVNFYNAILEANDYFSVEFKTEAQNNKFDRLVAKYILGEDSIDIVKIFSSIEEDGTVIGYYDLSKVYAESKLAYKACKSMGIKNGMYEKDAVIKMNQWLCKKMTYKLNYAEAYEGFKTGKGQCHTYGHMFNDLCKVSGMNCKFVVGNDGEHSWNRVKLGSKWYYLDITWNDQSKTIREYLLAEKLWGDHNLNQ